MDRIRPVRLANRRYILFAESEMSSERIDEASTEAGPRANPLASSENTLKSLRCPR